MYALFNHLFSASFTKAKTISQGMKTMQLQIRRNKEIGIQVQDQIVFHNNHAESIVVGKGVRGSFNETPYTPIKRYWSYKANLYQVQNKLIIQIVNTTKIIDIVDGDWKTSHNHDAQNLISMDGGTSWSETKVVEVESLQPISSVASQ